MLIAHDDFEVFEMVNDDFEVLLEGSEALILDEWIYEIFLEVSLVEDLEDKEADKDHILEKTFR